MAHADSKMLPMLSKPALSKLACDLAYHLSWEFFLTDHNIEVQRALNSLFPGGVPDLLSRGPAEVAEQMGKEVYELWHKLWEQSFQKRRFDTVAVGIISGRKEILVAANLTKQVMKNELTKKRGNKEKAQPPVVNLKGKDIFSNEFKASELGLYDGRHEENIRHIADAFPQLSGTTIIVLVPENRPEGFRQNRFAHAEMQILKYASDKELSIDVVGISKMACLNCKKVLKQNNIKYSYAWYGNLDFKRDIGPPKAFDNWGDPKNTDTKDSEGRQFPNIKVQVKINIDQLSDAGVVECDCTARGTDCDGCQGKVLGQNDGTMEGKSVSKDKAEAVLKTLFSHLALRKADIRAKT